MALKATRHTSTDLEDLHRRIADILKEPVETLDQSQIDVDAMTIFQLKAFAEQGGLGACVSKMDVLADSAKDLMYLSGERIVVLKHVENDTYLGYCEGVIGEFNAENVHFVELDPRVLDSLDPDLEFAIDPSVHDSSQYRSSVGTEIDSLGIRTSSEHPQLAKGNGSQCQFPRGSVHSNSSISERYSSSLHERSTKPARSSMESLTSNASGNPLRQADIPTLRIHTPRPPIREQSEHFDTSAFNDDYSAESEDEHVGQGYAAAMPASQNTEPPSSSLSVTSPVKTFSPFSSKKAFSPFYDDEDDVDDEDLTNDGDDEEDVGGDSAISSRNSSRVATPTTSSTIDEYGFIIDPKRSRAGYSTQSSRSDMSSKSVKAYRERESKWLAVVNKLDAGTVKKDAKLKKLVRSGIPTSVRARVWQFLASTADYRKPETYQILVSQPPTEIYEVIERDIARCYPDHTLFKDENGHGQRDLGAILKAYSQYNTELEYCQGMGRLAGCMLMHMPAEDAFWLLVATIDRYMNGYFTPSLSQLRIDAYIIGQLLKDHHPKLAQHLENNDVVPIMYIAQWFLTAFTMTLPWNSVLRVWDVFYFEGVKVFYRISLAILEICKDHLLQQCPTNSELLDFLLHIPHDYLEPDALLDTAFKIKLSKTDLKRYAKKASTSSEAVGLPVEHGLKNLMVGNSTHGLSSLKSFSKIKKKSSSSNMTEFGSSLTIPDLASA